jgi:hypothetical protein
MDEQRRRMRARLEKELDLPRGAGETVWQELEAKGLVAEVMQRRALFRDLLDEAKDSSEYWKAVGARKLPPGRRPQEIREHYEVELGEYENERAAALSEVLAQKAAMHHAVVRFRKEILGGRLLGPDEAHAFVTSPAVRFFWRPWFEEWEIPLLRHDARIDSQDEDHHELGVNVLKSGFRPEIDRYVSVFLDPPGITKSVLHGPPTIRVPAGLAVDKRYLGHEEHDGVTVESPEVVFPFPSNGAIRKVRALPGSLLSELHDLSGLLVELYDWRQEQAGWFVLTGETPRIEPITVSASLLTGYRRIAPVWTVSLEVAPWVDAKEVTRIYREIQKQILQGDNSRVKVRNLAILRFVTAQTAAQGKRPPWRTLLERWNETYPEQHEWRYGNGKEPDRHVWNFRRDYDRAEKAVLRPNHHFPKRKATTSLEDWAQQNLEKRRIAAERFIDDVIETLDATEYSSD